MPQTAVDVIGFSFVLKIFAGWGMITMLVSLAVSTVQKLTSGRHDSIFIPSDPWRAARQNRDAAIIRHYPDAPRTSREGGRRSLQSG